MPNCSIAKERARPKGRYYIIKMKNWCKSDNNQRKSGSPQRESAINRRKSVAKPFSALLLLGLTLFIFFGLKKDTGVRAYSEMTSSSFKVKDWALDSGGGTGTSSSFKLDQAIGQEFQDKKTGSNYTIYEGIMYYPGTLSITCGSSVSIPTVLAGSPENTTDTCTITTDSANGFSLYTYENKDLEHTTNGGTYINPSSLGSYDAPEPWDTGTDVGLGLSLCGTSAEAKWDDGGNFTSFISGSAALLNDYSSPSAGGTNLLMTYQLDVEPSQRAGEYSNEVYYYVTTNFF